MISSELRFRTLFDNAPFSVQLLAGDGRTLQVNAAWEALWQGGEGDGLKQYVLSEYNVLADPQLEAKGVAPGLRRAFAGESVTLPLIVYDPAEMGKPGHARWIRGYAYPMLDDDGKVGEVVLIHEDVTERVRADNALRSSEMRIKQLANTIPQLAWIAEPDGAVHWYNDRWYAYTGTTPEEMHGWGWQSVPDPGSLPAVMESWQRSLATGEPFQMTIPMRGGDGRFRPFFTLVAPLKDADGKVVQWFGTNTDVSTLQETEAALRESDRRKDEFLAMLAHELRNPLAPITSAAHLLHHPGTTEKQVRLASEIIARQARHMTELVDDLLDVSRVTRGLVQLKKEALELKSVLASAVEQVRPLIEARRHVLATRVGPEAVVVHGDRTRLVQAVVNLLNNAAKYTPEGGEIRLAVDARAGEAVITVQDNGIGIDAAFVPHVFELFTQAARTPDRAQGGLGIGLALVKSIASLHQGRVEARSAGLGAGSTFTLTLPLLARGEITDEAPTAQPAAAAVPPTRILIVDDNLDAARSLAVLLETAGHTVSVHQDAKGALAAAAAAPPQVFILDIGMPVMNGYELARELRRRGTAGDALMIALTGYGQPHDHALSTSAGFDHHLVKPVDMAELDRLLAQAR